MKIDNQDFTIYYSNECPYVEYEVNELTEYAKENNITTNIIKIYLYAFFINNSFHFLTS